MQGGSFARINSPCIGWVLASMLRTKLNYKKDPYVHPQWCLGKPNIDSSSNEQSTRTP